MVLFRKCNEQLLIFAVCCHVNYDLRTRAQFDVARLGSDAEMLCESGFQETLQEKLDNLFLGVLGT